jgi:EmrB/QacA subfamily drug resistance transporter
MSSASPSRADRLRPRHRGWALALLAFAQLIIALDYTIVYVALPEIGTQLGFSGHTLQWVVSGYAVAFGGFLLLGGRAADALGRRRMFVLALLLYAGSSLLGGLATGAALLVAARVVQGIGGALLFPATLSLVNTSFAEGRERNRALAVWGTAGATGLSLGSLLGGALTEAFGWEAVFFVNVPLAAVVALLAFRYIPRDPARERGRSFDLPGALTATGGVTLLVIALVQGPESGWGSTEVLGAGALAVALLALFVAIEARSREPLMPLRLFVNRSLSSAMAVTFVFMGTLGALPYFLTLYFQTVHGYGALSTGLAFLGPSLSIATGTVLGERLVARHGMRVTLAGGLAAGAGGLAVLAAAMSADATYLALLPGIVIMGVGQGVAWTGMWIAAGSGVAGREQGIASGMASTTQQVGAAVGLALLIAVSADGLDGLSGAALRSATADGLQTAVYISAAGLLLGVLATVGLRRAQPAPTAAVVSAR